MNNKLYIRGVTLKSTHAFLILLFILFNTLSCTRSTTRTIANDIDKIELAQIRFDYTICEEAGTYRFRCIAETELEERFENRYVCCPNNCPKTTCLEEVRCGPDTSGLGGCPPVHICMVNPTWLCTHTGGDANITNIPGVDPEDIWPPSTCTCPKGMTFIDNFGCADCELFTHPETREYCKEDPAYYHPVCRS
jgi:hypothetical protein